MKINRSAHSPCQGTSGRPPTAVQATLPWPSSASTGIQGRPSQTRQRPPKVPTSVNPSRKACIHGYHRADKGEGGGIDQIGTAAYFEANISSNVDSITRGSTWILRLQSSASPPKQKTAALRNCRETTPATRWSSSCLCAFAGSTHKVENSPHRP